VQRLTRCYEQATQSNHQEPRHRQHRPENAYYLPLYSPQLNRPTPWVNNIKSIRLWQVSRAPYVPSQFAHWMHRASTTAIATRRIDVQGITIEARDHKRKNLHVLTERRGALLGPLHSYIPRSRHPARRRQKTRVVSSPHKA
jgi:hypothetical protein